MRVEIKIFAKTGKKSAYLIEYLSEYWIDLHKIFSFERNM